MTVARISIRSGYNLLDTTQTFLIILTSGEKNWLRSPKIAIENLHTQGSRDLLVECRIVETG
uniref:Uncharacterized protein n=1 Tax=Romanomermis culicivorax TaxID=13658 RepID=A0A915HYH1_ROMCU